MDKDPTDAGTAVRLVSTWRCMPRLQREIFLAVRLDDLSYAQVAERTGLSVGEVERQFAEALIHLGGALDRGENDMRRPSLRRRIVAGLFR